jgi:chemotaxis protein MotB
MARRKAPPKENHDRWLVSYADLVTLLFAFFVVLFASTQSDKVKAKQISQAVERALEHGGASPRVLAILDRADGKGQGNAILREPAVRETKPPAEAPAPPPLDLDSSIKLLHSQLSEETARGSVAIHVERRGVVIGLNGAVFFPSGDDTIDERVYPTIAKVAAVLRQLPNPLRLEGHTDPQPIHNARFRSNWELSAARSIAMLRLLEGRYGVAGERLAIVGYADTLTAAGHHRDPEWAKNRRVDIVIVSDYGMRAEPEAKPETQPEIKIPATAVRNP